MKTFNLSYSLAQYASAIFILFGFFLWKRIPFYLQVFVILSGVSLGSNIAGDFLSSIKLNANHAGLFYSVLQLIIITYVYHLVIGNTSPDKILVVIVSTLLLFDITFWIYDGAQSKSIFVFATNSIFLVSLCLYYFYCLLKSPGLNVLQIPMFWISVGLIIALSSSVILYITNDYLYQVLKDDLIALWTFRNFVDIVAHGFFLYGIWLGAKEGKLKAAEKQVELIE